MWEWKDGSEFEEIVPTVSDVELRAERLEGSLEHGTEWKEMVQFLKVAEFTEKGTHRKRSHLRTETWLRDMQTITPQKHICIKHICATKIPCPDLVFLHYVQTNGLIVFFFLPMKGRAQSLSRSIVSFSWREDLFYFSNKIILF